MNATPTKTGINEKKKRLTFLYLQSTLTLMRLDWVGGTPFDATEKKENQKQRHMQIGKRI